VIADTLTVASMLGLHEFAVHSVVLAPDLRYDERRAHKTIATVGGYALTDARTGEPIAILTGAEALELAEWLERERPLPARPIPYAGGLSRERFVEFSREIYGVDVEALAREVELAQSRVFLFGRPGKAPRCCDRAPFHAGPCAPTRAKSTVDKPEPDPYTDEDT
jgi:hypothetical protein